jgi:hypothetical protein
MSTLFYSLLSYGVSKATGYGLNGLGVGVRVLVGARIFSSRLPDRLWAHPAYTLGTEGSFSGG